MSTTFTCLDFNYSVRATEPTLQALIEDLFAPFRSHAPPAARFTIVECPIDGTTMLATYVDAERVSSTSDPAVALAQLVWEINRRAVEASSTRKVLLHAAAAEHQQHAVLLPAPSGGGKSTLVAGLVQAGFGYLTDDVTALDSSGVVRPYPKPIAIARPIRHLFEHLGPVLPTVERYIGDEGYVTCAELGGSVGRPSTPCLVVAPTYSAFATTRLTEISRAETLFLFAQQSFNLGRLGPPALAHLGQVLRTCRCYRLEFSDLHAAVALITATLTAITAS